MKGMILMSWTKDEVFEFLSERPRVGRLATVTGGGAPRVTPVWFEARDGSVLVHTGTEMAKARNVAATGSAALAVDDDEWPYRGVSVWGQARLVDPDDAVGDLSRFVTGLAISHLGPDIGAAMGENLSDPSWPHSIIDLTVEHWHSFDYGG